MLRNVASRVKPARSIGPRGEKIVARADRASACYARESDRQSNMTVLSTHRNTGILATAQATLVTSQSMLAILSGLVGLAIADNVALATLPVSTVVIATTLTTIPHPC